MNDIDRLTGTILGMSCDSTASTESSSVLNMDAIMEAKRKIDKLPKPKKLAGPFIDHNTQEEYYLGMDADEYDRLFPRFLNGLR